MKKELCQGLTSVMRRLVAAGLFGFLALGAGTAAQAHSNHVTGLSGRELYPGDKDAETTKGVLFSGTDNAVCNCSAATDTGGHWVFSVDRVGQAGLGSAVSLVGGRWFWQQADNAIHYGRVLGGSVQWPPGLASDLGCGPGVAIVTVNLSVTGQATGGTFTGCLDDTHIPHVFPPKVWGTLSL